MSGLSAAGVLSKAGVKVTILEARDRIGGRIHTWFSDSEGHGDLRTPTRPVDLGASFVHGTVGNPLTKLVRSCGAELHFGDAGSMRYIPNNSAGKVLDTETAERLEFFSHATTFSRLQKVAQEGDIVPDPTESVWSALTNKQGKYDEIWKGIKDEPEKEAVLSISSLWNGWTGADLNEVSLQWWGYEQEYDGPDAVVFPGYFSVINRLEQEARSADISLGRIVTSIKQGRSAAGDEMVIVTAEDRDVCGQTGEHRYEGSHVICTIPLGVLKTQPPTFTPNLPKRRWDAIGRVGIGILEKVVLVYAESWWSKYVTSPGQAPASWLFLLASDNKRPDQKVESDIGTIALVAQNYERIKGHSMLVFFFGPPSNELLRKQSEEEVVEALHQRLVRDLVPEEQKAYIPRPTDSKVTNWGEDKFSAGSYSYIPPEQRGSIGRFPSPLDMKEAGHPLWDGRLGFAGEHTSMNHYASVHGAHEEGLREGKRLLDAFELEDLNNSQA